MYILGGLLFGIATFRAGILPRWAAGLLVVGSVLAPVAALLPPEHQPKVAVWSERREQAADSDDDGVLTGVDRPVVVPSNGHVPSKV